MEEVSKYRFFLKNPEAEEYNDKTENIHIYVSMYVCIKSSCTM